MKWAVVLAAMFALSSCVMNPYRIYDKVMSMEHNSRGWKYDRAGQFEKALSECNTAIKLDPKNAYAYCSRGDVYLQLGQYKRTIDDCTKAIDLGHQCVVCYVDRAAAYGKMGQTANQNDDCEKAVSIKPVKSWEDYRYCSRGDAFFALERYFDAAECYSKAIALSGGTQALFQKRAETYIKLGQTELAESDRVQAEKLKEAAKRQPNE